MDTQKIDSLDDPRLCQYRNLKDRQLSREGGFFIAEGEHVVQRLLASVFPVESVLLAARKVQRIGPLVPANVPVYVVDDQRIHEVVGYKFHAGVIACGKRVMPCELDHLLPPPSAVRHAMTIVICPQVINHENLGSLIRISAAFGADAMLLGEQSCDPFWRRSIRVSMGTVFHLPLQCCENLVEQIVYLKRRWSVQVAASVLDEHSEPLSSATAHGHIAILLGSEAHGLDDRYLSLCDRRITIPMRLGTDSLNLSVAAAVFLYHFTNRGQTMPIAECRTSEGCRGRVLTET